MSLHSLLNRFCDFPISHRVSVMMVTLIALAWSSPVFCGEIHDAAKAGNLAKVKTLVKDNPDLVFTKDNNGHTPLHTAAVNGQRDLAELLLANGADVNAKDTVGDTPLRAATLKGHREVAELLRQHGSLE